MITYTIKENEKIARPFVLPRPRVGRSFRSAWRIRLGEGTDYVLNRNVDQWNKLCGETFNPIDRSENAILLGWRHVNGIHQITPYYNVKGEIWMPERRPAKYSDNWPVIKVEQDQDIFYGIYANRGRVIVTIGYVGKVFTHRIVHSGTGCFQYEVNFYFGGQEPAPQLMQINKERLSLTKWEQNGTLIIN